MPVSATPGPWSDGDVWPDPETGDWHGAISSPDQFIANVLQSGIRSADEARTNLRLFAAAPELLTAANEAFDFLGGVDGASEIRATLLAAISKATSRQPEGER